MWTKLLSFLSPLFNWLLSYGVQKIIQAIQHYRQEKAKAKEREAAFNKAKQEVINASKDNTLTEEERLKRQEDAFQKLVSTVNPNP